MEAAAGGSPAYGPAGGNTLGAAAVVLSVAVVGVMAYDGGAFMVAGATAAGGGVEDAAMAAAYWAEDAAADAEALAAYWTLGFVADAAAAGGMAPPACALAYGSDAGIAAGNCLCCCS